MPIISIIIPVYNVEKYLRRCLDSVLVQTFTDYECIIVDDGSLDNCPVICDEYADKDRRFKAIHKQMNAGLPKARKTGLDAAVAEFVTHLDSDDWLEQNALELLYIKQQETDADLVLGGFMDCYQNEKILYTYPTVNGHSEILNYFFLNRCQTLWSKLYKKHLFNNYIVPSTNMGEDAIVNIQIFLKIRPGKLQILDNPIYNYNRINGITTRIKYKYTSYLEDPAIQCRLWIENYINEYLKNPDIKTAFDYYMITEAINPYLRFNRTVTYNEVNLFYVRYYKDYPYKKQMNYTDRFVIPLFHFSIFAAKLLILPLHVFMLLLDGDIKALKRIFIKRLGL